MQLPRRLRYLLIAISIPIACLVWATLYVFEAANDPFAGDETALFIQPLFYLLVVIGIWVVIEAIADDRSSSDRIATADRTAFGASGLWDRRRLVLILSLPSMVLSIWLAGFVIAVAAYAPVLAWAWGERRMTVLSVMALSSVLIAWLLFKTLMGVPLPLWPAFVG